MAKESEHPRAYEVVGQIIKNVADVNIQLIDLQKDIINKLTSTKTLSFDFRQKISDKEEVGICFIKYPLLEG